MAGVALCALLAPVGAGQALAQEAPTPTYTVDEAALPFEAPAGLATGVATDRDWGVEDGAGFRIEKPAGDAWNGELVTWSHGFVSPTEEELVVDDPPLREFWLSLGYGWAASSYSRNGYVIEQGVEETQALLGVFEREFGVQVERRYATGASMGGHVVGVMIERYPDTFAGALPICGAMGDVELYDYFVEHATAAQALAGVPAAVPAPDDYLTAVAPAVQAELGYGPGLELSGAGHQLAAVTEDLSGGERPLFAEAFEYWSDTAAIGPLPFLLGVYGGALTGGPEAIDGVGNADTVYQLDADADLSAAEVALNDAVPRLPATGEAPFPLIDGTLGTDTKVLTLHTIGDLFVPFSMQQDYLREAVENGADDRLVQRAIRAVGHCAFSGPELATAFTDLVTWVEDGAKPAGDDVLDPAVVADRDYGCTSTLGQRPGLPACGTAPTITRVEGADRIATAAALVAASFDSADSVVLARADDYADALAAAPLAASQDAPVLLTGSDALPSVVAAAIETLGATDVVLLGGEQAISADVARRLADAGTTVTRIGGADRYDTARLVAEQVGGDSAFVVRGSSADPMRGWPDAVSVSALAAFLEKPILLVEQDAVPAATAAAVASLGFDALTVVGGPDAVAAEVATALGSAGADVDRVSGDTRYGTSAAVAELALASGMQLDRTYLATGTAFADALVAGPVAAAGGSLLLLVDADAGSLEPTLALLAGRKDVLGDLVIVGGPAAVSPVVQTAVTVAVTGPVE